jgi:P-type Ca2+ transporter type 2C
VTQPSCWWQLDIAQVADRLASSAEAGLSAANAKARLEEQGPNQLAEEPAAGVWIRVAGQFRSLIVWVLLAAAVVSGALLREYVDAAAIVGIVLLNAILGFVQEARAEKALAALRKLASPASRVIRDGRHLTIPAATLVAGDLIEMEAGDHVPADARVVFATSNFSAQEASLTGESAAVVKRTAPLPGEQVPLADRHNMVFLGTVVVTGRSRAIVTATGMRTELGHIAGLLRAIETEPTPLQKKLDRFGRLVVQLAMALVAVVFALEWWRGGSAKLAEAFLTAVSLAVAAIPEGLPAVVTIALALGVQRMVKRHALIRKLPSVETLGCATVICSDKTGTLTRNEMTVQAFYAGHLLFDVTGTGYAPAGEFRRGGVPVTPAEAPDLLRALTCGTLCNGAHLLRERDYWTIAGDPTEAALLTCAAKAGIVKEQIEGPHGFVDEIPFDSDRKMMTVIRRSPPDGIAAYVKGAPDIILGRCIRIRESGEERALTAEDRSRIQETISSLSDRAMRVLGLAERRLQGYVPGADAASVETDLTFLGLAAMIDPPRDEAREAIRKCRSAGIRPVMITGDHRNTAVAIARDLGFFEAESKALTGVDLDVLSEDQLAGEIASVPVYARVSPEHKLRIVRAWRRQGQIVAMTGDGVNDAPAVKEADIGVAMGITGTDVTKEVSDMIVTDDNFASIVAAVEEGRGIYDNILKFVHYLLSCNAGEILVMFLASLLGMPAPLLPVQILWVNLVTDGLPALALGMDPVDPQVMSKKPRDPAEPVVTGRRGAVMILQGAFIALCTLGAYVFVLNAEKGSVERARTVAFVVLSCSQLFHAFNCRSETESIFSLGVFSNVRLVWAALASFGLQLSVVTAPVLQTVFKTEALNLRDWCLILLLSSFPLWAMESSKLVLRRRERFLR